MKTLLVDNFDSFTYNLYQLLAEVNRVPPVVIKNNSEQWPALRQAGFDNIVISPGPGRPEIPKDFGICAQIIAEAEVPILGVCLGHQGLCHFYGGQVDYAAEVMHGRVSNVVHNNDPLFANIPSPFRVVRYHSLVVRELSDAMVCIATTSDGTNMAVRHKNKPIWGVQFHPESVCTDYGKTLLSNFRDLSRIALQRRSHQPDAPPVNNTSASLPRQKTNNCLTLFSRRLALTPDPEQVFLSLYQQSHNSFWLDADCYRTTANRFSYMGDTQGPHAELIQYDQASQTLTLTKNDEVEVRQASLFSYLKTTLFERAKVSEDLPFDFNLGYVGYFGYEMKGDCGYPAPHASKYPDASLIFCDRMLVLDHTEHVIYLVCLDDAANGSRVTQWMDVTQTRLEALTPEITQAPQTSLSTQPELKAQHSDAEYLVLIRAAKDHIKRGESYEICLTNQLSINSNIPSPLTVYRRLRQRHPAPYAGFLKFGALQIASCSPETFLSISAQGCVTTKPIKGTRPRAQDPVQDAAFKADLASNEKDRAENLMIVDLLRNDLGQVSEVGSVKVTNLFNVESYSGVHQLVSTITSRLRRDCDAIDCLQACFPGGSMTGAPKRRTMEIIDTLEGVARGVYSGTMGFLALNGSADLSIVIRTLVCDSDGISLGVGGAIVDLSDANTELQETKTKSYTLLDLT